MKIGKLLPPPLATLMMTSCGMNAEEFRVASPDGKLTNAKGEKMEIFAQEGAWAPEMHEYKGNYYLFTTLHNEKKILTVPSKSQF